MKTLATSCSNFFLDKIGDGPFSSPRELRHETSVLPSKKLVRTLGFFHGLCVKHKTIRMIPLSSSLSDDFKVDLEAGDTQNQEINGSRTVRVKFQLQKECCFGEQFIMVGDDPMLGVWDPAKAIPLNWSDGHLWASELDIPIGKSIHFKFILNGIAGMLSWQPGPDRFLQTWETINKIIVWEDWEDASLQKLVEEELFANKTEELTVNTERPIVAGSLISQKEEVASDINNGVTGHVNSNPEKNPSLGTLETPIVADNICPVQEKPLAVIADNLRCPEEVPALNFRNEMPGEKRSTRWQEQTTMSNKGAMFKENDVRNADAPTAMISANSDVRGSQDTQEGDLVLVPGLSPVSVIPGDAAIDGEGTRSRAFDASVGVNEVKNHNLPELDEMHDCDSNPHGEEAMNGLNDKERYDNGLIDKPVVREKQQVDDSLHQEERINGFNDKEKDGNELVDKPVIREKQLVDDSLHQEETINGLKDEQQLGKEPTHWPVAKREKQQHSEFIASGVVQNDLHWIQKLLTSLGLL